MLLLYQYLKRQSCRCNYKPSSMFSNFSKLLKFITHDHVSHYAKFNTNQHGFIRTKSRVTICDVYLHLTPVVRSQRQADAVYFDLSNAFDLVPHNMLLHKLSSFGFFNAYVSWFRSYLSNRQSRVSVSGTLSLSVLSGNVRCSSGLCSGAFSFQRIHK
jgi:hypothetical protein